MGKVFPLVLNQCTAGVHEKLEALAEWGSLNHGSDVIGLLHLIKSSLFKKTNRNMSKSKGWTLQSSLLMLWMDENSSQ